MSSVALTDRVAIVTGASSGLGARFATVLADAGAQVVTCARRLERLKELAGKQPAIHPIRCDVAEPDDRAELVATTLGRFGRIDICVNNAGSSSGGADRQATVEGFRDVLRLNLEAVYALSLAVSEPMRAQKSGSVINVSSMFSFIASTAVRDAGLVTAIGGVICVTREFVNQKTTYGWCDDTS